jgi:Protein of unknown function (DUF1116)
MTEPHSAPLSLPASVGVVNVGLPLFADAIREQGAPVITVDWRVPAGGHPAAVAALGRLYGIHAERIDAANAEVLRRLDQGTPLLTGITTVVDAVPGLPDATLLHCGPAISYADAPDPLRRSMRAAAVAEGWAATAGQADAQLARGEIELSPANAHRVVVPMATALGPSAPLYELVNDAGATTAYAPISQGPGEVAWFGCASEAAIARLVFLREVAAPVIRAIVARTGPLDVLALAAQAVTMGDDVHVRTQAATNLLIREWLPHLAELGGPETAAFARFLAGNHLFFLTLAMGAARSLTEWAAQVPESSIVTTMARNGTTFGIRLAGSGRWFLDEAPEVGHALYYSGQGPQTSARDIGDSAVLELSGLGAAAAAGSPAVAQILGGQMREAADLTQRLAAVCAGRSSRFKIPVLDNIGTPLGVDVRKVVELGSPPAVTTGILHRTAGTGQVGAGVAEAPLGCFADAMTDLDRRLSRPLPGRTPRHRFNRHLDGGRRGDRVGDVADPEGGLDEPFDHLPGRS